MSDDKPETNKNPARELDDESLFDRLFPVELRDWLRGLFGDDEDGEEE